MTVIETTRFTIRLEQKLRDEIERLAAEQDRKPSSLARLALKEYVAKHGRTAA